MKIPMKNWNNYVTRLSAINKTAGRKMQAWIDTHGTDDVEALVDVAYALATRYGEAASATACQMYDETAQIQKAHVPPAEPKPTQNIRYVDAAVRSALSRAPSTVPKTVSELVKRTGAETTLKNAVRDGAYFAWVPRGDTCPFCITLASNGWRKASKKTVDGDHAEHIHHNCNCEFVVNFGGPGQVEGYDPDALRVQYDAAEGNTWQEKVNSMRRAQRENPEVRARINAQQRKAYAIRQERRLPDEEGFFTTWDFKDGNHDIIKPRKIYKELNKTPIGKEAKKLIEDNGYEVKLLYGIDSRDQKGKRRKGVIDHSDKVIKIYVDETQSIMETAMTVIHEAYHLDDYGYCRKSEVYCEIKAKKHQVRRESLTPEEIRDIMNWAKRSYDDMPWR